MIRAIHTIAAFAALMATAVAQEDVVIDSHSHLSTIMRREAVKAHSELQSSSRTQQPDDAAGRPGKGKGPAEVGEPEDTAGDEAGRPGKGMGPAAPEGDAAGDAAGEAAGEAAGDAAEEAAKAAPQDTAAAVDLPEPPESIVAPHPTIPSAAAPHTALARTDLATMRYVEEKVPGSCTSHYEYQGLLSDQECAERCYAKFGCIRFSGGGCDQGCRISVVNQNIEEGESVPADGQCKTAANGKNGECVVYRLAFYHAIDSPATCSEHFELDADAKTTADCAHACKNTEGCRKFSAAPNCAAGCRISKCGSNPGAGACPDDKQCVVAQDNGCTTFEVFR